MLTGDLFSRPRSHGTHYFIAAGKHPCTSFELLHDLTCVSQIVTHIRVPFLPGQLREDASDARYDTRFYRQEENQQE
jgi:hypothetical protein